jgi:uncharacterized protein YqgC (DUF456 family)
MTIEQILGLTLALLVMLCGSVGSVLPGIPGTPLVLIAAVVHRLYFGPTGANNWVLVALIGLTLISVAFDYTASVLGAKKLGATWRGMLGAIIGGMVGVWFNVPGILLGPFVGAMVFEFLGAREVKRATRAGLGATLGLLAGAVGKVAICVAMMGLFALNVIYRSMG